MVLERQPEIQQRLIDYVEQNQSRLFALIGDLVRRASENTPPLGNEGACQQYIASALRAAGWEPDVYELDSVAGLRDHPLFVGGREYAGRPNIGSRRRGSAQGRSLILSGHIDTVPRGTQPWTRDAFGGQIEGNRLYGRGSNDMKAGVGINLFVAEAVEALDLRLAGDLIFETVVDEEFGGVNGTLAGRLRGYTADAAIITEPTNLKICPAQRGGQVIHLELYGAGGMISLGETSGRVTEQLAHVLAAIPAFTCERQSKVAINPYFIGCVEPFAA